MTAILILVIALLAAACGMLLYLYTNTREACINLSTRLLQSERQNTQDQDALRQRRHLDTIKDEFISTVSHELRTPLTSIRGALGLLSAGIMGQMDDKAQNLLRIASNNTDRLVRLINDILDLERMDSGRAPLNIRRCSLPELVKSASDTMASMADGAGVKILILDAEDEANPEVFDGDSDRILQVLCNLLSNAIKFSPRGSEIKVTSQSDNETLMLRIEDHGRGVPAEKLESIFDRFSQVDPGDSKQKGGTGLGLAISRSILSQHGGAIWAERNDAGGNDNPGTTFLIRIPRVRVMADEPPPSPVRMQGAILVVDDDALVRQVVAEQLRRHGYDVLETDRGEQAIYIAERQHVEAILLDLYMPGLSGWETLERLKRNPNTAEIPVVVLSVLSPASHRAEGPHLLSTAQGWVQKPFNESLLLAELGRVLHTGAGPGRILLVEDDDVLADVVIAGFQDGGRQGMQIDHVHSLQEARRSCEKEPPDIMILDLSLPDGDGFTLVQWLREQPTLRKLPLVVYSGREVSADEMEQLRLGPTQFLTKTQVQPEHVEELVLAMVRNLRHPTLEAQTVS
ncbi:MAG TPA: response regulator [Acidobacteriaceae bacterium]|jgi:signal transduction histidine kinase/CheY-like chemotaxis protein